MPSTVNLILLVANVIGAVIYVIVAGHGWAIPQERGLDAPTGEPFVWALYVMPIWPLFGVANLIWGAVILFRKRWRSGRLWLAAACIWLVAVTVDLAHH
jgi:hypothetical protein